MINFDWTIGLGSMINLTALLISAVSFFYGLKTQFNLIAQRVENLEKIEKDRGTQIESIARSMIDLVRYEERTLSLQRQIDAINRLLEEKDK